MVTFASWRVLVYAAQHIASQIYCSEECERPSCKHSREAEFSRETIVANSVQVVSSASQWPTITQLSLGKVSNRAPWGSGLPQKHAICSFHVSCPCNKPPHFWKGALGKQIERHSNDPRIYSIRSNTSNCVNLILHVRQNFWTPLEKHLFSQSTMMDLIWWRQRSEIMASQEKMSSYVSNAMAKLLGWCWKSESI